MHRTPPATKREGHLLPKSAQATSNALACEANQLTQHRTLAGWFTMTRRIAPRYVRIETRRQRRESDAHVYPNGKVLASSSHPSMDVTRSEGLSPVDTVSPKTVLAETPTHHLETYWLLLVRSRTQEGRANSEIAPSPRFLTAWPANKWRGFSQHSRELFVA